MKKVLFFMESNWSHLLNSSAFFKELSVTTLFAQILTLLHQSQYFFAEKLCKEEIQLFLNKPQFRNNPINEESELLCLAKIRFLTNVVNFWHFSVEIKFDLLLSENLKGSLYRRPWIFYSCKMCCCLFSCQIQKAWILQWTDFIAALVGINRCLSNQYN